MVPTEERLFFDNLIARFCAVLHADAASLYILDDTSTRLRLTAASGYHQTLMAAGASYAIGEGLTGWIARTGEMVRADSFEELARFQPKASYDQVHAGRLAPQFFLGFPLKQSDGRVIGVIKTERLGPYGAFTSEDEEIAKSFADLATMAISLRRQKENLSSLVYAFVLMPFDPHFNDIYQYGIKRPLNDLGIKCERVDEIQYVGGILDQVIKSINAARLVIADMTGRNPNVFYEVGYCHAVQKDVILCTQSSDDIPFDLRHMNHIIYEGKIKALEEALRIRVLGVLRRDTNSNETAKHD